MKTPAALGLLLSPLRCVILCALLLGGSAVADDAAPPASPPLEELPFECKAGVSLELDGLTDENAPAVKRALSGLKRLRYRCPACKTQADWPATCEGCGEWFEVMERGVPLLTLMELDVASQRACVEIDSWGVLTLSALGKALEPTGVKLNRGRLDIVAWTRITVRMAQEDVGKAKKALQGPGLFASVGVRVSESSPSTSFIIEHPPRRPVTLTDVAKALGKAVPAGVVFEDVSWTAACLSCKEAGRRRGGCRSCWHAEFRRERVADR